MVRTTSWLIILLLLVSMSMAANSDMLSDIKLKVTAVRTAAGDQIMRYSDLPESAHSLRLINTCDNILDRLKQEKLTDSQVSELIILLRRLDGQIKAVNQGRWMVTGGKPLTKINYKYFAAD